MGIHCNNETIEMIVLKYDLLIGATIGKAVFSNKYCGKNIQLSLFCFLLMCFRLFKLIFEQVVQGSFWGVIKMFKAEWKKLSHDYGMILVLVMIALIPAIYCWLYLSSMWNTYGKMADIPVAVVNQDKTRRYHGKTIQIGHNLVKSLKRSDSLAYHQVSKKHAEAGLATGQYYMIVTIPSDFSKNATTLLSNQPHQLQLHYRISSGRNFIVSKMTTGAANAIQAKVATQVTKMYASILLGTVHNVKDGLRTAGTGSQALAKGDVQLQTGANGLSQGTQKLFAGLNQLQDQLPTSSATLPMKTGLSKLSIGSRTLTVGTLAMGQGLTKLKNGNQVEAQTLLMNAGKLSTIHDSSHNATILASPVKAITTDEAKVPNNGTGMAPFAIAIGLFVGGIAVGTMFDAYTPVIRPRHWWTWWGAKFSIVGLVGLLQASGLFIVLRTMIGLQAKTNSQLFWLLLLGSLTFLAIIFGLRILLGGFGTWLITIVLVLQLSASAGLYPVQLTSSFASRLNPYLPMTYLIDGLRHAISLGGSIRTDSLIMLAILLVANGLIAMKFAINIQINKFGFLDGEDLTKVVKR